MGKTNWWMVAALTLSAMIVLLLVAGWLTQDWTSWDSSRTMPRSWSIWRVLFAPFMFLMPLVWLALPILGIACMIRWMSGGSRHGSFGCGYSRANGCPNCGRSVRAGWRICPYCGHELKMKEAQNV